MMASNPNRPKYNVLVMGKTQAGKSTLIQHIKSYVDPSYKIDPSLIGNGNVSKTEATRIFSINSSLPKYEPYHLKNGKAINIDDITSRYDGEDGEEDYREFIAQRDKKLGVRRAAQDNNTPVEAIEFTFLDTPGINDTEDRDANHAVNIISEMIQAKHFNLIIIISSMKNPITQDNQLALEYYADVFKGLHNSIMFLITHVDYNMLHPTNVDFHLNLKMKVGTLKEIMRRPMNGEHDNTPQGPDYSFMTVDLVDKPRPIVSCFIRNTIREILVKATQRPSIMDTSAKNIDRIRGIIHPTKFNDEQRKAVKKRFQDESEKLDKPEEKEEEDIGGEDLPQINILLIGDVQSGKSSLVETMKMYGNVEYKPNTSDIVLGASRYANEKVRVSRFISELHTVEVRKTKDGANEIINLEEMAKTLGEEDFEDLLNLGSKSAETQIITLPGEKDKKYRFNIYEGPSLNESGENFERNIFSVHKTIVESKQKFHQVLFTLAPGPITSAIRTTIRVCSDIFSDLAPLFSFVHTKIDYSKLHDGNAQFKESMKERQDILQRYIQTKAVPFLIDCNLDNAKLPVQQAKTQNTISDILRAAIKQTPVELSSPLMKKTPKMVLIDTNLKWQARDEFQETQKKITENNQELLELRSAIRRLDAEYKAKDQEQNSARHKEDPTTRADLEVIYSDVDHDEKTTYANIFSKTMTFKKQPRLIEHVHIEGNNVEIEQQLGGVGCNHWKIIYRRKNEDLASLSVKIYAKKLDTSGAPQGESPELAAIRQKREELVKKLEIVEERVRSVWKVQKEYNLLRDWISRETLPKAVMEELTKEGVYESQNVPYDKIKKIYLSSGGVYDTEALLANEALNTEGGAEEDEEKFFSDGPEDDDISEDDCER
ncbi:hypothetical protein BGZ94_004486 [Podila epigama]|nr:hypothetical protein BGZ94_004486 [Podila epigama]